MSRKPTHTWPAVVIGLLLLVGGYVGSYFAVSDYSGNSWSNPSPSRGIRSFPNDTLATFFFPVAQIESKIRRIDIVVLSSEHGR